MKNFCFILLSFFFFSACTQKIIVQKPELIPSKPKKIRNTKDIDLDSLAKAAKKSLKYFYKVPQDEVFTYGKLEYSKKEMIASTELLLEIIKKAKTSKKFISEINKKFLWFQSPGREKDAKVLFTGYFEPQYQGSLEKSKTFSIPIYPIPEDLEVLDLGLFRKNLFNQTIVYRLDKKNNIIPYHTRSEIMQGILKEKNKPIAKKNNIIPYHTRSEIMQGILKEKNKPIAWLKDITDLFFLQVQGSGLIETEKNELLRLGYAGANGRNYTSVGKILIEENIIPSSRMSMSAIRQYLKENPKEKINLLNQNESYVFFRLLDIDEGPYGSLEVALTPKSSLATDYRLFPKGALAYIQTNAPNCKTDCLTHKPLEKFLMIQDTGGAIRGFGRADVFWGRGNLAAKTAGFMQHLGDLFVLVAKKEYISF